ncbi:hypothetical protein Syun_000705 [Stephania yunnanensis]|uniref:Uncharacterized protein n=1 Tax=Stephania yunnanensis TaxID=152371 RepID=A0AAP0Q5T7_9MAGN
MSTNQIFKFPSSAIDWARWHLLPNTNSGSSSNHDGCISDETIIDGLQKECMVEGNIGTSIISLLRVPDPDTVLVIQSPSGVFSTKSMLRSKTNTGSRLISSRITEVPRDLDLESEQFEPFSAARCRTFKRSKAKVTLQDAIVHRLRGPCHHSLEEIESLNKFKVIVANYFATLRDNVSLLKSSLVQKISLDELG